MNTSIVIVLFAVLFVALIGVVLMLSLSKKGASEKKETKPRTLQDFIAEGRVFSGTNLQTLIEEFLQSQKLPFRQDDTLSSEAKQKLEFVRAVASNKNANAKHISFLNRELVKKYGTYKADIESYEKIGLEERKNKWMQLISYHYNLV